MSENARSIADLDRRIERLQGRGSDAARIEALREARTYMAKSNLLPENVQTRRPKWEHADEPPAKRGVTKQRNQEAPPQRIRQHDRRDGR